MTVGICVRNCQATIGCALSSVFDQDYDKAKMEIILVDDGSVDDTLKIMKRRVSGTEIATQIYHQEWRGIAAARNTVLRKAHGKYVIWVDGDMRLPTDHVRRQIEFMERNAQVGIAKAQYGLTDSRKVVAVLENSRAFDLRPKEPKFFGTGGSICLTKAMIEVGGFDEGIKGAGEDSDMFGRITRKGWLMLTSDAYFYETFKETWPKLWEQYSWWGFGACYVKRKQKGVVYLASRLPPAALLIGVVRFFKVYRHTHKLIYLLLPVHNLFKETAWTWGFVTAYITGYGKS